VQPVNDPSLPLDTPRFEVRRATLATSGDEGNARPVVGQLCQPEPVPADIDPNSVYMIFAAA